MKTSARFLAMLLATLMIASAALSVSAFPDVKADNDYAYAIDVLSQLDIIGGYEDGTFRPDQKVTRAEMAKLVFVLYTTFNEAGAGKSTFTDVAGDHWATGYINWCANLGIIGGYGDGTFGPDANVTYDQALKMVCGALGYTDWDSTQWPVDVRLKALRELNLGNGIEDVNGSDELTRGAVAQIMYNALYADMNETVKVPTGYGFNVEKPKVLAYDVWNFMTADFTVVATENRYLSGAAATGEEDEISLEGEVVNLADLGLNSYKGKTDELIGRTVTLVARDNKLLPTATVKGAIKDDVKVTVSSDKKTLTIDGKAYTATSTDLPSFSIATSAELVVVSGIFVDGLVSDDFINYDIYFQAVDFDGDDKNDVIFYSPKALLVVKDYDAEKDEYTITTADLANEDTFKAEEFKTTLNKGDVVVAYATIDGVATETVAPVETYATKVNATDKKVTLNGQGEVDFGATKIFGVDAYNVTDSALGTKNAKNYYIYNGIIYLATEIEKEEETVEKAAYNFALISYFNQPGEAVLNTETMKYESTYSAVVIIDGKQKTVPVVSEKVLDNMGVVEAIATYPKVVVDKYLAPANIFVTYTIDKEGNYSFKTVDTSNTDYTVIDAGAEIVYDATNGLYTIKAADTTVITNKAIMSTASEFFYIYTKEETGAHKYVGTYKAETLPANFEKATTASVMYVKTDAKTGITTIIAAVLGTITEKAPEVVETINYKKDGNQILYCYSAPVSELDVEERKLINTQYFKNIKSLESLTVADKSGSATAAGNFYAWDEDLQKYVRIDKATCETLGVESVKTFTINTVVNNVIFTTAGEYAEGFKLPATTILWTPTSAAAQKAITVSELKTMVDKAGAINVIAFYTLDEEGNSVLSTLVVEDASATTPFTTVHNNFGK